MTDNRDDIVRHINECFNEPQKQFAITHASMVDARGRVDNGWIVVDQGIIFATGTRDEDFISACRTIGLDPEDSQVVHDVHGDFVTPGYIDIHCHGAWQCAFDDDEDSILRARAGHAYHGTTRQVLSLITNPLKDMCENLKRVHSLMAHRPDILGSHLEGPFLALSKKGAHDPLCLCDPHPELVNRLLEAADGSLRHITLAPEREYGLEAISRFAEAGVVAAVGHCDADYDMTRRAFDAGARLMTHMFNAMNGMHHRKPGPIPAALEDPRVLIEFINDGFHVNNPILKMMFELAPHRLVMITDAMAATDCPDGSYTLGSLEVNVESGHARLVSNGAIAGSTLLLEVAMQRAVLELGLPMQQAIEALTLLPARVFDLDRPNDITGAPLGLLAEGYAADFVQSNNMWVAQHVWSDGHQIR